jgi:hypothetical protein
MILTEKERIKRLIMLVQTLISTSDFKSIELLKTMVENDTPAMIHSFGIMTSNLEIPERLNEHLICNNSYSEVKVSCFGDIAIGTTFETNVSKYTKCNYPKIRRCTKMTDLLASSEEGGVWFMIDTTDTITI